MNAMRPTPRLRNALTVDVEEHFQVEAFAGVIPRDRWEALPSRVEANTQRLLDLFARAGVRGTFFTLSWVAERHPALIRRIVAGGHELASHGHGHARVPTLGPDGFRADIRRARQMLQDIGGVDVLGYRAPTFSLGPDTPWAYDILAEEGYRYSSSIYPIRHDLYGAPDAPLQPFHPDGRPLLEIPMTATPLLGRNLPCAGGGFFRLLPYGIFRLGLLRVNRGGRAGIFYTHPWEVDPGQPRVAGAGRLSRFRHYLNLSATAGRLERLLADFAWDRMDNVFGSALLAAPNARFAPAAAEYSA
jgi:polysaccharide deacetylase family protein (PEP-CTERM system associated)